MQDLQAICFDLDDTFWDVRSVLRRAEDAVSAFLRERHPGSEALHSVERRLEARLQLAREQPARAHDLTWLRTEAMRRLAREAGLPEQLGEEAFGVFMAHRNRVELFDDVLPALQALGSRYALATLSNGNADLVRIGIAGHFAVSLNAIAVGAAKPDPRAFRAVADALALEPQQIAYVGDDPHADVRGAREAGMYTVWINRVEREWPADAEPATHVVRDLGELAARLVG